MQKTLAWFLATLFGLVLFLIGSLTLDPAVANAPTLSELFIPGVGAATMIVAAVAFGMNALLALFKADVHRGRLSLAVAAVPALLMLHFGIIGWVIVAVAMTTARYLPLGPQDKAA